MGRFCYAGTATMACATSTAGCFRPRLRFGAESDDGTHGNHSRPSPGGEPADFFPKKNVSRSKNSQYFAAMKASHRRPAWLRLDSKTAPPSRQGGDNGTGKCKFG